MRLFSAIAVACIASLAALPAALAKPPIEAFSDVPVVRSMELSPDGKKVAFLRRVGGTDVLTIYDFAASTTRALARVDEIRARYVHFVGNNQVILVASEDRHAHGYRGRWEYSAAFAFDLTTGESTQLLRETAGLVQTQTGLGQIVGVEPGGKAVYMPAFMSVEGLNPSLDLLRVSLESGRGARVSSARGTNDTRDWLVNAQGAPALREDFTERRLEHRLRARQPDGEWKTIYQKETPVPEIAVVGVSADGQSAFAIDTGDSEFLSLFKMSLADGAIAGPLLQRDDADVADVVTDVNRVVHGVRYSGMFPSYSMFDATLDADINSVLAALDGSSAYLDSWSDDWSKLLFLAEGGASAERYLIYDRATKELKQISSARPDIKAGDVGQVTPIAYKARDGLRIPSLVTWPPGVAEVDRKKLPLVVLPHGGPQSYDSVGFEWMAQFLANEGYAVLQPNFRGSAGFGASFAAAGYGEWGRKMQDDITDGANALVKMGWADPARICIVGWSYGGYAALAGGAATPDLYKCVASIAGVSNLRDMLSSERNNHGARSSRVAYWEMLIGDPDKDGSAIDAVSPALHAGKFKSPVLLIHGVSDTVVPVRQSDMMNDALKGADKQVQYIRINGDDHGLVDNDSRRQVLTALSAFLQTHIGR